MSVSPTYEMQMLPSANVAEQPTCDESMYFDETWKSYDETNNNSHFNRYRDECSSLSDCVPSSSNSSSSSYDFPHPAVPVYSNSPITGSNALLGNHDHIEANQWRGKDPVTWNHMDVALWLQCIAETLRLTQLRAEAFADVDGSTMCIMQMEAFQEREPNYGSQLYMAFSSLVQEHQHHRQQYVPNRPSNEYQAAENLTSIDFERYLCNISFDGNDTFRSLPSFDSLLSKATNPPAPDKVVVPKEEANDDYADTPPPSPTQSDSSSNGSPKGSRRGRSKGKLWEFVLNLLLDKETNPDIIKWEDRSNGVFRIVRSDQVAQLWGKRKSNPSMTYEKMSRAMRYYYRKNILERIDGRRLVYKFGPTSRGWQI